MNSNENDPSSVGGGHRQVQPKWVKALTVGIAFPAWLVLMVGVLTDDVGDTLETAAVIAFMGVAVLQLAFVFRAYWRMDL